ncbi:hypothetical protein Br6_04790 [Rhodococcus sp. Br-6]|nr:hypothetical protein Br6_04790 [Rhodococcus sp. Br-6]
MPRMAFDRNNHLWQELASGLWQGPNGQLRPTLGDLKRHLGPLTMVRNLPESGDSAAVTFPSGGQQHRLASIEAGETAQRRQTTQPSDGSALGCA